MNKRKPVREGMLSEPLDDLSKVKLLGSRCNDCDEVFFVVRGFCERCQSRNLSTIELSRRGKLWSYTVVRASPRPPYVFADSFQPFAVGWISLPEGLKILASLTDCDIDKLNPDMDVELVVKPLYKDSEGCEVITYYFKPISG